MIDLPGGGKAITVEEAAARKAALRLAEKQQVARHVLWHNGDPRGQEPGSFTAKLLDAWVRADEENSFKLQWAFPLLGLAVSISRSAGSDALAQWAELPGSEPTVDEDEAFVAGELNG